MKVFLSIKHHPDFKNHERISHIMDLLSKHHMEPLCIPMQIKNQGVTEISPDELMRVALLAVRESKLMVVDLTEKGVGIGIEAGYAHARGIPIVTLSQNGSHASESLLGISNDVCYYQDWEDLNQFLAVIEQKYVPQHPTFKD